MAQQFINETCSKVICTAGMKCMSCRFLSERYRAVMNEIVPFQLEIEIQKMSNTSNTGCLYYSQMAKDIVETKEYMPQHPLTRHA